jgi:hypothetical protein
VFLVSLHFYGIECIVQNFCRIALLDGELYVSGFYLRQIEQFAGDLQQAVAVFEYAFGQLFLFFVEGSGGGVLKQLHARFYCGYGRFEFVRYGRDEIGFGKVEFLERGNIFQDDKVSDVFPDFFTCGCNGDADDFLLRNNFLSRWRNIFNGLRSDLSVFGKQEVFQKRTHQIIGDRNILSKFPDQSFSAQSQAAAGLPR